MIYRLQRRFILVSAISVFAVVILIFLLITVLNVSSMNHNLDMLADSVSKGDGRFPGAWDEHEPKPNPPDKEAGEFDFITSETPFATRHFSVWFDEDGEIVRTNTESIYAVSEEDAKQYASEVIDKKGSGWISQYRYKVFETERGKSVVFIDGSVSRASLFQSMMISAAVLIGSALIILFLIVIFSKRVMKPVAESYEKQKQFITDANHELKTPLTLILANLDIAEAELGENEWLSDIRSEGQRMTALVERLVALSRMDEEKQELHMAEVNLTEIAADVTSEFASLAEERGQALHVILEREVRCQADERMLRQLLSILLDNAIKYCDPNGDITVTLAKQRHVTLCVENTYHAVDKVEKERLFDRFYRADAARTYTGGFGIGLSIAKAIVGKHHGEISAYKKDDAHIGFRVVLKH